MAEPFTLRCPDGTLRRCWWNKDKRPWDLKFVYLLVGGVRVDGIIVDDKFFPDPPNGHLVRTVEQTLRLVHG